MRRTGSSALPPLPFRLHDGFSETLEGRATRPSRPAIGSGARLDQIRTACARSSTWNGALGGSSSVRIPLWLSVVCGPPDVAPGASVFRRWAAQPAPLRASAPQHAPRLNGCERRARSRPPEAPLPLAWPGQFSAPLPGRGRSDRPPSAPSSRGGDHRGTEPRKGPAVANSAGAARRLHVPSPSAST